MASVVLLLVTPQTADASTALLTDRYELTMLTAALHSGAAGRRAVFEVFARALPNGRRYGVVAGTGRFLDALEHFTFGRRELAFLRQPGIVDEPALRYLESYRFSGDIWGYGEGDCYFPGSPILVVEAPFAEAVVLETLALAILNHDSAIASAASRMVTAADGRPLIEMGSRRTHEMAAVASARAAYLAGFGSTSNLRPAATTASPPAAPARMRSAWCTTVSGTPSAPSWPRWAPGPRCWWTRSTWPGRCAPPWSWPGRSSARCGSTAATCPWWPARSGNCWTSWARGGPGSCSAAT